MSQGIDTEALRRHSIRAVAVIAAFAAILLLLLAVRFHEAQPDSGDEPHYLIVTASLIYDGPFDVKQAYRLAPYRPFPDPPDAHINTAIFTASSPHWYSSHGPGLAVAIYPGAAVDNARGAAVEMVGISALVLLLTYFWARRFASWLFAAIATAALGFSPFFLGLDGRIFPDLPTAALLLGCLLILELPAPRAWQLLLLGALVACSPWVHFKNGFAFATIVVIAVVLTFRRSSGLARLGMPALVLVPALASAIWYELTIHSWYRSWLPTHMITPGNNKLFALSPFRGLGALSFDASHGLLSNNPALLLILAGLPVWFWRSRSSFLRLALVIGPTILLESTFNDWSGGFAPAGRYALQFAPSLVPAIALVLRYGSRGFRAFAAVLIGLQAALAVAYLWLRGPSWRLRRGLNTSSLISEGHLGLRPESRDARVWLERRTARRRVVPGHMGRVRRCPRFVRGHRVISQSPLPQMN